jgi:hypothetical protein
LGSAPILEVGLFWIKAEVLIIDILVPNTHLHE